MKRPISLFLALLILLGVLVSCENPAPTPETLKKDCEIDCVAAFSSEAEVYFKDKTP